MVHVADKVDRMVDAILMVERVARALSGNTGKEYDEVRLKREIGFFEESLKLSRQLIESSSRRKKGFESRLFSLWSIPAEARVIALYKGDHSPLVSVPSRFSPDLNFFQEITRSYDAFQDSATAGLSFEIPPTCWLGEVLYQYRSSTTDHGERSGRQ